MIIKNHKNLIAKRDGKHVGDKSQHAESSLHFSKKKTKEMIIKNHMYLIEKGTADMLEINLSTQRVLFIFLRKN